MFPMHMMPQLLDRRQLTAHMIEIALRQCRLSSEPALKTAAASILETTDQILNRFPNVTNPEDRRRYITVIENYTTLISPSLLYNGREVPLAAEITRQSAEGALDHVLRYFRATDAERNSR